MKFIIDVPDMFIGVAADNMAKELRSIVYDAGYGKATVTVMDEPLPKFCPAWPECDGQLVQSDSSDGNEATVYCSSNPDHFQISLSEANLL